VALELGAILKLKGTQLRGRLGMPPSSHFLFSRLIFTSGDGYQGQQVDEHVVDEHEVQIPIEDEVNNGMSNGYENDGAAGDWLDNDDIGEF